jgi:acetyl-CoA acetyltransferase
MTIKGKAYIAGIFEHPTRKADDKSLAQLHAEAAAGALGDAGLTRADVDGYFCAGDARARRGWALNKIHPYAMSESKRPRQG